MNKSDEPIIVEESYNSSIMNVWTAITEPNQMQRWFLENIPPFKPEIGIKTQFNIHSGGRDFLHLWEITEVIPLKQITYSWRYDKYEGDSLVMFELIEEDNQTKIRLTHTGMESFSDDIPEFRRQSGIDGWNYFIKNSLKAYLEKGDDKK